MPSTLAPIFPFKAGVTVSQNFGMFPGGYNPWGGHTGKDFAVPIGTAIYAAEDGVIEFEGWVTGQWYENPWWFVAGSINIVLNAGDHKNSYTYGHLNSTLVNKGDYVKRGQIIGYSGNTGQSTGPHCHFEVLPPNWDYNNGTYGRINPDRVCVYWDGKPAVVDILDIPATTSTRFAIDISLWQGDIDIARINPDMVLIKATQGAGVTDPWHRANVMKARNAGKPLGHYHYSHAMQYDGNTPQAEARYFIDAIKPHYKKGDKLVLDWEERYSQLGNGQWARDWADQVCRELGADPDDIWFYANTSVLRTHHDGLAVFREKYNNLWVAFYGTETMNSWGDPETVYGNPPIPDGWNLVGWQYTQYGRVSGYSGDLDLNIIYDGDDMAITDADLERIADHILRHDAWGATTQNPNPPQVSEVLLHSEQVYQALFFGGESTPDKTSLITFWKNLNARVNQIDTNVKALPEKFPKPATGSTTPATPTPVLDGEYTLELKKVQK